MIRTSAGTFNPNTNQSSKKRFKFFLLPSAIPIAMPINIAIKNDINTLFKVMNVCKNNSELLNSSFIIIKTSFGLGRMLESVTRLAKAQIKKKTKKEDTLRSKFDLMLDILF